MATSATTSKARPPYRVWVPKVGFVDASYADLFGPSPSQGGLTTERITDALITTPLPPAAVQITVPDATQSVKGILRLNEQLRGGTADNPRLLPPWGGRRATYYSPWNAASDAVGQFPASTWVASGAGGTNVDEDTNGIRQRFRTNSTLNNSASLQHNIGLRGRNPEITIHAKFSLTEITNVRFYFVLCASVPTNTDTNAGVALFGIRFSTVADATQFYWVQNDAAGNLTATAAAAIAADTPYQLVLRIGANTWTAELWNNDGTSLLSSFSATSEVPSATTDVLIEAINWNLAGGVGSERQFNIWNVWCEFK